MFQCVMDANCAMDDSSPPEVQPECTIDSIVK